MAYNIYTTYTLKQVQTVSAIILSVLGIGWFFFLSNVVKYRALRTLRRTNNDDVSNEVPILETIVPTNIMDVFRILKIKRIKPVVSISIMVIFGLVLTSFEGIIVINTVYYAESCKITTAISKAQITEGIHTAVLSATSEIEAMMHKRNKSGVPDGTLLGQIPIDDRWKFNAQFDVDPYPCRSSCSLYKSGITQVNMNTSVLFESPGLREKLPEIHAEYIFRNNDIDGYNFTTGSYSSFTHLNKTRGTNTSWANGVLITLIEAFTQGNFSEIGDKYMNRIWTLKVPETIRIPYDPNNPEIFEIMLVPIAVKAYTCEVERVKEGVYGSYNLFRQNIRSTILELSTMIERRWKLAIMKGNDASIYELTPEHWASYLTIKDLQTALIKDVPVQIDMSCISIHPVYILLIFIYAIMIVIGGICLVIIWKNKLELPTGVMGWASQSCKEYDSNNAVHNFSDYNLVASDKENINLKKQS